MDKEIEAFRNEVARLRGTRRRGARPFSPRMREQALRLFKALCDRGLPRGAAARQVGITAMTLTAWQKSSQGQLVPVRVVPDVELPGQSVRLLSPRGYRVEVPDVASAVALLRELG